MAPASRRCSPVPSGRRRDAACAKSGQWRCLEVDIREAAALEAAFAQAKPEVVVHLAARAGIRPSLQHAAEYAVTNVLGTINLWEAAAGYGVSKFLFASSSSVYGASEQLPSTEDQRLGQPLSPYAASKMAAEAFCYTLHRLHRIPTICLRFFTVYGPRQRSDQAIHKFVRCLEEGRPIPLYGEGTTSRAYTYVDDIVRGLLATLSWKGLENPDTYEVINLGSSQPVRLSALVEEIQQATGRETQIEQLPQPPGEVSHTCANLGKAQRLLGWQPQVDLPTGLREFVRWYRRRFG